MPQIAPITAPNIKSVSKVISAANAPLKIEKTQKAS